MAEPYASRRRPRGRHRRHDRVRRRRLVGFLVLAAVAVCGAAWIDGDGEDGPRGVAAGDTSVPGTGVGRSANGGIAEAPPGVASREPATATPSKAGSTRPGAGTVPGPTGRPPSSTAPAPTAPVADPITLAFAGDLLPHMPLNRAAATFGRAVGRPYDYAPMLAPLQPIVGGADLALCHLEVPIAPSPDRVRGYPVFGAPPELVAGVASAGYDGCSTASNHTLDQGLDGIKATLDTFDVAHLGHTGSARSAQEAATPRIYSVKGVKVASLSYAYGFNGYRLPAGAPWAANQIDPNRILADAHAARAAGARLVVVSLHWGTENLHAPNAEQRALAPVLTASPDIDVLIGHHAHVVQPIEWINGKPVVFGLGNQLSNQTRTEQRDGLTVVLTAQPGDGGRYHVTGLKAVPTYMDGLGWRVLPIPQTLADPATAPALRAALRASYDRTMATVQASGPVLGLTADPLPLG